MLAVVGTDGIEIAGELETSEEKVRLGSETSEASADRHCNECFATRVS